MAALLWGACACATPVPWAPAVVDQARARSFPELENVAVDIGGESERFVGGRALFGPAALFVDGARDYQVLMSSELVAEGAGEPAIRYVAAHELAHLVDFEHHPGPGGLWQLLLELWQGGWRLERRADVIVMTRGYLDELVVYRRWKRARLASHPELLAEMRRNYFSPNEALAADEVRRRCPAVFQSFLEHPPSDLRDILKRCP